MTQLIKTAIRWGTGLLCSTLIIWLVSIVFVDNPSPFIVDKTVNDYTFIPETTTRWRSEGWADSRYGLHGFGKLEDALVYADIPKFILWGDSNVESTQVADDKKISAVFNSISNGSPYSCLSYGRSGRGVPDYYFVMPEYERVLPGVKGHVILLSGMSAVLPFGETAQQGRFRCAPWRLERGDFKLNDKGLKWGPIIHLYALTPFYRLYQKIKEHRFDLLPNVTATLQPEETSQDSRCDLEEGWRFLLANLKKQSNGFFVFIYCPATSPALTQGKISTIDHEAKLARRFKQVCKENGVGFIDMTKQFSDMYRVQNIFPRGFFNSPPGTGHLNKHGLEAVARSLHNYFREEAK